MHVIWSKVRELQSDVVPEEAPRPVTLLNSSPSTIINKIRKKKIKKINLM